MMKIIKNSILLIIFISFTKIYCQENEKAIFGLRYTFSNDFEVKQNCNFRVTHHIPVILYHLNSYDFYVGPQYTSVSQPTPRSEKIYNKDAFGINLGCRYYSKELVNNLQIFGQFNFSIFRIKFEEYQHGPPYSVTYHKFIVENTITIGVNYCFFNKLNLFTGIGIGSFNGFFLMLDKFNLNNYIGIGYEF